MYSALGWIHEDGLYWRPPMKHETYKKRGRKLGHKASHIGKDEIGCTICHVLNKKENMLLRKYDTYIIKRGIEYPRVIKQYICKDCQEKGYGSERNKKTARTH